MVVELSCELSSRPMARALKRFDVDLDALPAAARLHAGAALTGALDSRRDVGVGGGALVGCISARPWRRPVVDVAVRVSQCAFRWKRSASMAWIMCSRSSAPGRR